MIKTIQPRLSRPEESTRAIAPTRDLVAPEWVEHFVLPELYCPFTSAVNQYAEIVDLGTKAWVRRHGLFAQEADYQRFSAVRLGWLAARTNPTATREHLQTVTDWCSWFFIRDDYCDECGIGRFPQALSALHARFLEVLRGAQPTVEDSALTHALHELWSRTQQAAPDPWKQRFVHNLERFFDAGVWEAQNRARDRIPTVAMYMKMRPYTGGLYAYFDLFDISEQICLPRDVREYAAVQRLTTMANNIVCWANDIMSLPKEIKQGDVHNLVLSMRQTQRLTLQEAVNRAAALHDAEVRAFIELELRLPARNGIVDPELKRYTSVLRSFVRGSLDWLYTSGRYLVPDTTGPAFLQK